MNLPLHIARRYLFAKKSTNVINVITGISVLGITIGTAALILILTVFNGLENLISGFFNSFNPPLKVSPVEGKSFYVDSVDISALMSLEEIQAISQTLEELVLYEYDGIQEVGYLKGVDEQFTTVNSIDSIIRKGSFTLRSEDADFGVFGAGMANKLNLNLRKTLTPVRVFAPARQTGFLGSQPYKSQFLYTAGTFSVQSEEDNKYAFSTLPFLQSLIGKKGQIGYLEISINSEANVGTAKTKIKAILGEGFTVKDQYEQDASFLRVMKIEKWLSYAIACFTLLLIAFNMVGALWMIVLEKQKDLSILRSMGMTTRGIERIFILEGLLICAIGFVVGSLLALFIYFLQVQYGLVPIPPGSIIDTYPVLMKPFDFVIVLITVMTIGFLASILPAKRAGKIGAFYREVV